MRALVLVLAQLFLAVKVLAQGNDIGRIHAARLDQNRAMAAHIRSEVFVALTCSGVGCKSVYLP